MPLNLNQVQTLLHSITVDVNCVSNVLCLAVIAIGFSFLLCCFFLCLQSICLFSSVWFRFRHFLPIDCVAVFLRPVFLLVPCVFSQLRAFPPVFISFTLVTKNYSPLPSENKPKIHSPPLLKPIELPASVMTVLTHQSNPSHLHTLTHSRKKASNVVVTSHNCQTVEVMSWRPIIIHLLHRCSLVLFAGNKPHLTTKINCSNPAKVNYYCVKCEINCEIVFTPERLMLSRCILQIGLRRSRSLPLFRPLRKQ